MLTLRAAFMFRNAYSQSSVITNDPIDDVVEPKEGRAS